MKALLYNFFVIVHGVATIIWISSLALLEYLFSRVDRERVDRRLQWWARKVLRFIDLDYQVINRDNMKIEQGKPYIIMCNHSSLYDIPLSLATLPGSIRMMAKRELFRVPLWGWAMKAVGFVSIDRRNKLQAIKDIKTARKTLESGIVLWISPEGTRSKNGKILPFKKGCFRLALDMGATIIPVGIRGIDEVLPAGSLKLHKGKRVEVHVGEGVDASKYNTSTREELIKTVEAKIYALAGQKYLPQ